MQSAGGYTEFAFAPPHNEPDLNRCSANAGAVAFGGTTAPCAAFARYILSGHFEMRPFGRTFLKKAIFFVEPRLFLGNNLPQVRYTYQATPIGADRGWGLIYDLPKNLELRLTQHGRFLWFGRYGGDLGRADLGGDGPLGLYSTASVRWKFGACKRDEGR